jgi:hypothetical protein
MGKMVSMVAHMLTPWPRRIRLETNGEVLLISPHPDRHLTLPNLGALRMFGEMGRCQRVSRYHR